MGFLDKFKTKLFGEKDGTHGFWAGFVPTIVPPLAAAGAIALGAPVLAAVGAAGAGVVVVAVGYALTGVKEAQKNRGYNFKRYFAGEVVGCVSGAALLFNVAAAHLPQEQPKAPVAKPVPSTLEIKARGGGLCKGFNVEQTTDAQGRKSYTLFVPEGCTVPAAAPR